jgi:hypothetical protein
VSGCRAVAPDAASAGGSPSRVARDGRRPLRTRTAEDLAAQQDQWVFAARDALLHRGEGIVGDLDAVSLFENSYLAAPPAGFEPAHTAPERVRVYSDDQRKLCRVCHFGAHIGRDSAGRAPRCYRCMRANELSERDSLALQTRSHAVNRLAGLRDLARFFTAGCSPGALRRTGRSAPHDACE